VLFDKNIPPHIVRIHSQTKSQSQYLQPVALLDDLRQSSGPEPHKARRFSSTADAMAPEPVANVSDTMPPMVDDSAISEEARNLARVWLSLENTFRIQGAIFGMAGIKSGSRQARIKKSLEDHALIKEHHIQKRRTFLSVWEPTPEAYRITSIKPKSCHSKGGYIHQFVSHYVREWALREGYSVKVEFFLPGGKAVDLVLQNDSELIFVEIAISPPAAKEVTNIIKNLSTSVIPDKILVVVKNAKFRDEIKRFLDRNEFTKIQSISIEFALAGEFVNIT